MTDPQTTDEPLYTSFVSRFMVQTKTSEGIWVELTLPEAQELIQANRPNESRLFSWDPRKAEWSFVGACGGPWTPLHARSAA
jgi:hypothetical protein